MLGVAGPPGQPRLGPLKLRGGGAGRRGGRQGRPGGARGTGMNEGGPVGKTGVGPAQKLPKTTGPAGNSAAELLNWKPKDMEPRLNTSQRKSLPSAISHPNYRQSEDILAPHGQTLYPPRNLFSSQGEF